MQRIPFNRPDVSGAFADLLPNLIESGHLSSGGSFTKQVSDLLTATHNCAGTFLTTSCTDALEMCALLLDLKPSDEVILPSFTFTSTATAFARQGAGLMFGDISPVTLGLNPESVRNLITPNTKAVVGVNYAGVSCEGATIRSICDEHSIKFIEDNAHGLFGEQDGRILGTFGSLSTLSFHETKNFICGEGGALIVNDEAFIDRAQILLDKGTNRQKFLEGAVERYVWLDHGSSFGLSEILAGVLWEQLSRRDEILLQRRRIHEKYYSALEPWSDALGFQLPFAPQKSVPADHMFYVLLPKRMDRSSVINALLDDGISATFHYVPLHSSIAGLNFARQKTACPVTDDVSSRLIRLPFFNKITSGEQDRVIDSFLNALRRLA